MTNTPEAPPEPATDERLDGDPKKPSVWQPSPRLPSSLVERPWR